MPRPSRSASGPPRAALTVGYLLVAAIAVTAADGRSLARALRVAGRLEPVFVDRIGDMAQAVLDNARPGDVVLCMGAGSIGAVAGQIVELGACSAPC